MKPLVTQKIEFGVRLENDEIVGEKKTNARERRRWWWFGGKRKQTHSTAFPPSAGICRGSPSCARHAYSALQHHLPLSSLYMKINITLFYACIIEKFNFRYTIL